MQGHVLNDAVTLVENAEHGDPLRHRRHAALARSGRDRLAGDRGLGIPLLRAPAAGGERERGKQGRGGWLHLYSGIHGS
jgi:hypothetical protein